MRERIARLTLSQMLLEHALRCRYQDYQARPQFQAMVLTRLDGVGTAEVLGHHH